MPALALIIRGGRVTEEALSRENNPRRSRPLGEVDILWLNGGLGRDGESIALTGATQPSVEDLVMGATPACPASDSTTHSSLTRTATMSHVAALARVTRCATESLLGNRRRKLSDE